MSDLLIKGMDIPKDCLSCPLMRSTEEGDWCPLQSDERNSMCHTWDELKNGCPLVEVPTPHGRLIDVSTAYQNTMKYGNGTRKLFMKFIDELPTVIEAEE